MSKALAIETAMKMTFVVIVVAITLAFLFDAFKINVPNIFKFLEDMFGLGVIEPTPGKALHVKLKPLDKGNVEIWEFHLTNELKHASSLTKHFYFNLEEHKKNLCTIYATYEHGEGDRGRFYYVNPGGFINSKCDTEDKVDNIANCINGFLENKDGECRIIANPNKDQSGRIDVNQCGKDDSCKYYERNNIKSVSCDGPSHYTLCSTSGSGQFAHCDEKVVDKIRVIDAKFVTGLGTQNPEDCKKDFCCKEQPSVCDLLKRNEKDTKRFEYIVKFGILCTNDGTWLPCTSELGSDLTNQRKVTTSKGDLCYECNWNRDTGMGEWVKKETC